ncbi:glycoside hydrolase family 108 protein [Pedobacter flavus]|uniref:Glycosyl hydrolase 108 family protein n=1 Tax=Pedobacter flavus TaxID=3113906 RepID=A0ABU7H306_9SPHI|nr:glycosyl hydrolase 108 family protein [Pedobacter sp. VNH31]MEE1885709.1 glycosyl hydrolase 108 family protein [Pedobacter sp. VNH31]
MADFEIAEIETRKFEGGYANLKDDKGGETYAGISRNFWPDWEGWTVIDAFKSGIPQHAGIDFEMNSKEMHDQLKFMVSRFYRINFWEGMNLDLIDNQELANSIYDFAVNAGINRSVKFIQEIVEVEMDGKLGPITINAINMGDAYALLTAFNLKRAAFYKSIAKGSQAKFLKSWLRRINLEV